ncbi:MAG TPA: pyridoxamine 5'-phosphate oxidase [Verrucomicrobiae bacterium]|nr:pyridoxamine 5'-phosphate oxidase [Verrucomicrobiae bacterium]
MKIADIRRDYAHGDLQRAALDANPLALFERWFAEAAAQTSPSYFRRIGISLFKLWHAILGHAPADVNAMVLATVDKNGIPSSRTVLLKGVDSRGFVFFTNYDSRKGRELSENPNASLTFYWPELERQVCVAGTVEKISRAESESYFKSRPRGSQLSAWASNQSAAVADRAALEARWHEIERKFPAEIPLPPNWGGFVLKPQRMEFWQGRPNRLHDRFQFTFQIDGSWKLERLAP